MFIAYILAESEPINAGLAEDPVFIVFKLIPVIIPGWPNTYIRNSFNLLRITGRPGNIYILPCKIQF